MIWPIGSEPTQPFRVSGPASPARVPVIAHVPHGGTWIPSDVRANLVLDDDALAREIVRMTDWHTGSLFSCAAQLGGLVFENRLSRLVVDPERFTDDAEESMSRVGMGAVYLRTSDGADLRRDLRPEERERLLATYFWPYARALEQLVADLLDLFGRCLIVDGHSFSSAPLPYELIQDPDRPAICIGTDLVHTPARVGSAIEARCRQLGLSVERDRPFAGTYVPLRFYRTDPRVASVMVEVRRDLYCDAETGRQTPAFEAVRRDVRSIVEAALAAWDETP